MDFGLSAPTLDFGLATPGVGYDRGMAESWFEEGLRFSCTMCGNCCSGPSGYVWFDEEEARAIADLLGISLEAFYRDYSRRVIGGRTLEERYNPDVEGYDCIFLDRTSQPGKALCSIYSARPTQCRTWPFWPENLRSARAWRETARETPCPGMQAGLQGEGDFYPAEQIRIIRDENP